MSGESEVRGRPPAERESEFEPSARASREQRALRFMAEVLRDLERRALENVEDHGMYPMKCSRGFEEPFRRGESLAYRDAAMRLEHFAEVV